MYKSIFLLYTSEWNNYTKTCLVFHFEIVEVPGIVQLMSHLSDWVQIKLKERWDCCLCVVREITVVIVTSLLSCCPPLTVLFSPLYSSLLSRFFVIHWRLGVCVCDRVVLFDIKSDLHFLWFSPNFIGIAIFKVAGYFLDGIFGSRV